MLNNLQHYQREVILRNGDLAYDSVLIETVQENKYEDSNNILIEMSWVRKASAHIFQE